MNEQVFNKKYETLRLKGISLKTVLCDMTDYCRSRDGECHKGEEDECGFLPLCAFRPLEDDPIRTWADILRHERHINS